MAAGLPVVGTNVEGIRDVIIEGKNGFLVQIDDTKDLKDALYSLIQNEPLRQKMGQESVRLARKKYSFQRCISEYEQLFSIDS
jgi:glycosyltransferase involved in cell wall biosynthesis